MRTPIENGLASRDAAACSIAKVSRALWPTASTTWSAAMRLAVVEHQAAQAAGAVRSLRDRQVDDAGVEAVFAAQAPRSRRASLSTTVTRRKVPMCGLETQRISSGAPARDELLQHLAAEMPRVA